MVMQRIKKSVDLDIKLRIHPDIFEKLPYDKGGSLIQQEINDLFNKQC